MRCSRSTVVDLSWLAVCFVLSSAWCISCAFRIGATFDEPVYVAEGLAAWRTWSQGELIRLGTMPLAANLQTLPLFVAEQWRGTPIQPLEELSVWLPWARLMTLTFWAMLLVYAWLIGKQLAGPWGGRCAVAFVACEPNLLAHASLATTDVALAACLVAALYHFERGRTSQRWLVRIGLPALCCAAAVLAKASAILFLPLCFVALETMHLAAKGAFRLQPATSSVFARVMRLGAQYRPLVRDYLQISAICAVLVFAYCGTDWRPEDDFVAWAQELPVGPVSTAMVWFSESLSIFPNAAEAFVRQVKHNLQGHPMYIAGHADERGVWYYFPLLLLIKLPLPLIACAVALPLLRPKATWSWPLACAAMLLAYSFSFRVQIGVRMVLPIIALLVIAIAVALVRQQFTLQGWPRRFAQVGMAAMLLSMVTSTLWSWPHGLCYANVVWGGSQRSYAVVSDSNCDWGQGLPDLLRWLDEQGPAEMDVWYFGADPAIHRRPLRNLPLHTMGVDDSIALLHAVRGRYLAVGATIVYGGYIPPDTSTPAANLVAYLRVQRPIAKAGPMLIYDLAQDARWADVQREKARLASNATEQRSQ